MILNPESFNIFLLVMIVVAAIVFIALYKINAGYGMFTGKKWGFAVNNKLGWFLMELPVFVTMTILWLNSDRTCEPVRMSFFIIFQIHYLNRALIYPFLIKGKNTMPIVIIFMAMVFNILNALMQGGWIFYISPENMYSNTWFISPQFIIGVIIFFTGMSINIHSDSIIRHLRKPGDRNHYLPKGGMFNYVTSANYFGELIEWLGFAILTWSLSGFVFVIWTFANLAPRAASIYKKYQEMFPKEMSEKERKRIIPFIY